MKRLVLLALFAALPLFSPGSSPHFQTVANAVAPCAATTAAPAYTKWVVIVMENHSRSQTVGHMPYLDSVRTKCGDATAMRAEVHPSMPNYVAMISGSMAKDGGGNFASDCLPSTSCQTSRASIFSQVSGWTFSESMGSTNCRLTNNGPYAPKHNPHTYFIRERTACKSSNVDLTKLPTAIAAGLRSVNYVVPNLAHDMHDGTIAAADGWLKSWLPRILNGPDYAAGHTAVVVTWDEPSTSAPLSTPIETVVISPSTPAGRISTTAYTHYSLLKTMELELGRPQLGAAATATSMQAGFNL